MHTKKLILLLLAILWLVPARADDVPGWDAVLSGSTDVQRPEWVDLGMCDVLIIANSSTLTPPTTVRLVHNTPTGYAPSGSIRHGVYSSALHLKTDAHPYVHKGYLYLLQCLRL